MNTDLDGLVRHGDRVREGADQACAAGEGLARIANGSNGHVIPAPVAYDLLGNVKVLLWYLREVAEFLPTGVAHSLTDDRLAVYDRGPGGDDRDPAGQLALATDALQTLRRSLSDAAAAAEVAQTALNGQGWNPAGEAVGS